MEGERLPRVVFVCTKRAIGLVFAMLLIASGRVSAELPLRITSNIPRYTEPTPIPFPDLAPQPEVAYLPDNLGQASAAFICGGMFESTPLPLATLNSATRRYHHIDALLGLNPYTTVHVLKFNKTRERRQPVVW